MDEKNAIMFNSVTHALRAQEILAGYSIRSKLVKSSRSRSEKGCGYSLYVPKNFSKAVSIIKASGIRIMGTITVTDGEEK